MVTITIPKKLIQYDNFHFTRFIEIEAKRY